MPQPGEEINMERELADNKLADNAMQQVMEVDTVNKNTGGLVLDGINSIQKEMAAMRIDISRSFKPVTHILWPNVNVGHLFP